MSAGQNGAISSVTIRPHTGWHALDIRELYAYRDLFGFLILREIKVRYAQSAIGIGWALLQPLFAMLVFTVVFGRFAKITSDGVPYALFSIIGLVPWMYFSNAVTDGVNSLITNANMLSKVYFPRLLIPLAAVAARIVDLCVASSIVMLMLIGFQVAPNLNLIAFPWLCAIMVISAGGVSLWLASIAIQYRDVKHALSFIIQILLYSAPVVYPASCVPESYQVIYAINPMVGVIEGLRSGLLGTREFPWMHVLVGTCSALLLAVSGAFYFSRKQRLFADVA
jgi:lipopolysaccharide transport system permease protein